MRAPDLWEDRDPTLCSQCAREECEDHLPVLAPGEPGSVSEIAEDELEDAVDIAAEGRDIDAKGVPYVLDGIIPAYGMLGFLVAYAKVGKTTFGQVLAAHVAMGRPFLGRVTTATRVLVLAAEDPPEYTAWLARHLDVERHRLTFRRGSLIQSRNSDGSARQYVATTSGSCSSRRGRRS